LKPPLQKLFNTPLQRLKEMGDTAFEHTLSIVDLNCTENLLGNIIDSVSNA
jgi:hypothetical protein